MSSHTGYRPLAISAAILSTALLVNFQAQANPLHEMSGGFNSAAQTHICQRDNIEPIFLSAALGLCHKMDKKSAMGKGGQLPWAQPGIGNGGNNTVIGSLRKRQKMSISARLKSTNNFGYA